MTKTLNATECKVVGRAVALRGRLYGLQVPGLADRFARELAASYREGGIIGVRMACADLANDLAHVPGAYDYYAEARSIAA